MSDHELSKSLDGPSELVLRMPIKQGLAEGIVTKTYKNRVADVTELFSELRIASRESRMVQPFADVVDRIQTIHSVHIAVSGEFLILTVAFDRPWEPYIRLVWQGLGKLLDVILINCDGYAGKHASDLGYQGFQQWIRDHQINTDTFYLAHGQTVTDMVYLEELERRVRNQNRFSRRNTHALAPSKPAQRARADRVFGTSADYVEYIKLGVRAMNAFHALTLSYGKGTDDHDYLLKAVRDVLRTDGVDGVAIEDADFPNSADWLTPDPALLTLNEPIGEDEGAQLLRLQNIFGTEITWFETAEYASPKTKQEHQDVPVDLTTLQGGIVESYNANVGCLILAQVQDPQLAREFLDRFESAITTYYDPHDASEEIYRNVGFTFQGLQHLEVEERELEKFPAEFQQGMVDRAGLLGDVRANHPDRWAMLQRNWPLGNDSRAGVNVSSVDMIIQLHMRTDEHFPMFNQAHPLLSEIQRIADDAENGFLILAIEPLARVPGDRGHFGFRDGISQPKFKLENEGGSGEVSSTPEEQQRFDDVLPAGELFLGHANNRGDPDGGTMFSKLQRDGTFLVLRKLEQHVGALQNMVADNTDVGSEDFVLGQLLGRNPDGTPLAGLNSTGQNQFDFTGDSHGEVCPVYSHIRRTNPRENPSPGEHPSPRILRRGMSYGKTYQDDATAERGLFFQAYNASIAEQFEVVQRWVSGGNRTSGYSRINDPLLGVPHARDENRRYPVNIGSAVKRVDPGRDPFVTLRWGAYLFVPALSGLRVISSAAGPTKQASVDDEYQKAEETIRALLLLENSGQEQDRQEALRKWKEIFEDSESYNRRENLAVWRVIRESSQYQGVLRCAFGVLVAKKDLIYSVLGDLETYDVEIYKERLARTSGHNYLGSNASDHARESEHANAHMAKISYETATKVAQLIAGEALKELSKLGAEVTIPLAKYVDVVLANICRHWFGIPEEGTDEHPSPIFQAGGEPMFKGPTVHCPYNVYSTSRYVFQPKPTIHVRNTAEREGKAMQDAIDAYLGRKPKLSPWVQKLKETLAQNGQQGALPSILLGALLGFLPSANGNFMATVSEWIDTGDFWRFQNVYLDHLRRGDVESGRAYVREKFGRTMGQLPVPGIIHRQAAHGTKLGPLTIEPGEHIVLGLVSATSAEPNSANVEPVFGGPYTGQTHACPGRNLALGTQLGLICGLFELPGLLRKTPTKYALEYQPSRF